MNRLYRAIYSLAAICVVMLLSPLAARAQLTPTPIWATYYGGTQNDVIMATTTDAAGNVYVTGQTLSTGLGTGGAVHDNTYGGGSGDAFVSKFSPTGQRLWTSYYGGEAADQGFSIVTDGTNVYVAGTTASTTGIAFGTSAQSTFGGNSDLFLAKFDASNGAGQWGTYYGGSALEALPELALTPDGGVVLAGTTGSSNAIATPGALQTTLNGSFDAMAVKFNASGTRQWGTYLGGNGSDNGQAIAVDASGTIYIGGVTSSTTGISTPGAFDQTLSTASDGFLIALNSTGTSKTWGTYWGNGIDEIKVDPAGNLVVAGEAGTPGLATTGSFQPDFAGSRDILTGKFTPTGQQLWATYFGGTGFEQLFDQALALDEDGNVLLTLQTGSAGLATNCSLQPASNGGNDAVIVKLSTDGSSRLWSTYYGAAADEFGRSIAYLGDGKFVVGGSTTSSTFPVTSGAFQSALSGTQDAFLTLFYEGQAPDLTLTPSTLAPMDQTACALGIPQLITGNAVSYTTSATYYTSPVTYQWQTAASPTGPWTDMPGEFFKDLQPLASQTDQYYRRLVLVDNGSCTKLVMDSSAVAAVHISGNAAPIANADGPQWFVCGAGANTVTLNGSATGGSGTYSSYQWYAGSTSGALAASTASFTTPAITQATTYTLKVTDSAGCVDIDQVTVVPAVANAGAARSFCQGSGGVQIGTPPVASPSVTYNWTLSSGASAAATLSCTNCAQPVATPAVTTTYRLTVTATQKSGATCFTTSDVTVTPVTAPNNTLEFAGTDKTICKNSSVVLGGTNDATFAYTWTSGQYLNNSRIANPTFNAGTVAVQCSQDYLVTATKNGCAFTDNVKVSVINPAIDFEGETKCGPLWIGQKNEANCAGATYAWTLVSGDGTVLQTQNGGERAYLKSNTGTAVFRRTVTLNGVKCSADVSVTACSGPGGCDFEIVTLSEQGCPKVFGPTAIQLGTTIGDASNYNFSWSPANLVDNASAATVNITSTAQATITVTITNKYDASITCQKSIVINPPGWSLPAFPTADKYTCPNVPVQIGNAAVAGFTYAWTPATGLSSTSVSNPTATVTGNQTFAVTVTETASGCKTNAEVTVRSSAPVADAGNDRAVCNGATVTLGTAPPAGTNWTYSWEPSNTAWTNGTDANDPQPQVQFAFATPQSYILTVTDPLSGCVASDTVVLRNTIATGEYAGAGVTTCEGVAVQLGRDAEPFAQYEWFMADGVTPATGLSSNTVANPTVTNPTATTTYVVKISYPGCNTPLEDQVTVTVNPVTGLVLTDKIVCPAGPIEIGYGATGNPAAPAGATYLWSPATGLSSTTAANPTATVTTETIYSVTVTLPSGCVFTDQVKVSPSANAGPDANLCPGESTIIGVPAIAGATYAWTGAGIVGAANIAQPTVKPTVTTTYTVSVTLNGCTTTDQVVVKVNTPADFAITGNTTICEGGVATLSLVGSPAANTTWQWSPTAGVASPNSTSTTVAATATTTYRLTQTNVLTGCSNYKEVVVVVNPNTIAATTGDVALCEGASAPLPLNVTSSGNYSYVWSPSVGLSNAFIANPTVTTGSPRTYSVTVTDNASQCQLVKQVNVAINAPEACYAPVTLTGNVFHDANALKDVTVNSTATDPSIPTGLYVTLVDSTGAAVKTVPVNADGTYDFGVTAPGDYSIVLHQTSTGSTVPSLPSGWVNTGENLGAGVGSDEAVGGILTGVTVAGTNVTNANFGIQLPPVTTGGAEPTQPNPGGTTTVDLTSHFGLSDVDGTVSSITFTQFPENVTTITINGTTYVAPGTTPGAGQQAWPAGNLTLPATGLSVLVDPVDGSPAVEIPFFVTDNGGLESNVSVVTADFTVPVVSLSGNVFHDANALTDSTVNTTGSVTNIPAGLYASLVDSTGAVVATVPVNADGTYNFGEVEPGTYSVVLHQTAAGSTTPSLPTGWLNTGENLGTAAGSDGTVNGILPNIVVTTTDVTNANFGVQVPPVTTDAAVPSQPNPGGVVTVDISGEFDFTDSDGTVETITFTAFPDSVTTVTINGVTYVAPGVTPGAGQTAWVDSLTVPVTGLTVLIDPIDGDVTASVPFVVTDNGGAVSNESTVTAPFTVPVVSLSGNVFHDANALTDSTVNTTSAVAIPTGLYASLLDSTGAIVATVPVQADGSYDFGNVEPGTYSVVLHQTAAGSTTPSLPTGWLNTGEHLGANAGSDGTVNGILPNIVVTTTDVTNANFGVQQPPVAEPKDYLIDQPNPDQLIALNGTHASTGTGTTSPDQLTGSDPEDGTLNGSGKDRTVVITTLPDNGELYYNGVLVTAGQVIPNYNPDSLAIKLTGTGYTSTTFEYGYVDEAGEQSPPATYSIRWDKPLPVTLISFTATAREDAAELNWATSEETNSDRFEIQRSIDGKVWSTLGNVAAQGESKVRKTYSFVDQQPVTGADNLFRLKMVDTDGTFAFSSIRSVRFESKLESSIYPNPVANQLTLKVTSWKQVKAIRIDNLAGLQVYSSGPVQSGKVDVSMLDAGVYVLRITHTDGSVHTHKFVHIK